MPVHNHVTKYVRHYNPLAVGLKGLQYLGSLTEVARLFEEDVTVTAAA